jgi:signal transduction histidine kinase
MYIQMAKRYHGKKRLYLNKSSDFIGNVIVEIRKLAKKLLIPPVDIIGLFDSIKIMMKDTVANHPIEIEFQSEGVSEESLDEKMQLTIFRIVQEQVNNILKHANATRATIKLSRQENKIILLISDNGTGCDTTGEKKGLGIINIRSRAELHYGSVEIASKPGEGFELKVFMPLSEA